MQKIPLNQEEVAYHAYGYTGFMIDISEKVQIGNDVITVLIDNPIKSGIFLHVEKDIEKKQAGIQARHEKASGKEQ